MRRYICTYIIFKDNRSSLITTINNVLAENSLIFTTDENNRLGKNLQKSLAPSYIAPCEYNYIIQRRDFKEVYDRGTVTKEETACGPNP